MNMEIYVSGDFGQQAGLHNCTIICPQSLKFWECDLRCDRSALQNVCGRLWRILIKAQGNRGRLKRIVMLCPCVCLCTSVPVCTHSMCMYLCWHTGMYFCGCPSLCVYSMYLGTCASVYVSLPLCTSASICFCICPCCLSLHMTLHVIILGSALTIKSCIVWKLNVN